MSVTATLQRLSIMAQQLVDTEEAVRAELGAVGDRLTAEYEARMAGKPVPAIGKADDLPQYRGAFAALAGDLHRMAEPEHEMALAVAILERTVEKYADTLDLIRAYRGGRLVDAWQAQEERDAAREEARAKAERARKRAEAKARKAEWKTHARIIFPELEHKP